MKILGKPFDFKSSATVFIHYLICNFKMKRIAVILIFVSLIPMPPKQIVLHFNNSIHTRSATNLIPVDMLKEDFEFVLDKLERIHPLTIDGFSKKQKGIIEDIRENISKPLRKSEFFFLVNLLFHTFNDAHTNLWPNWQTGLSLPLLWLKENLYVLQFQNESRYLDYLIHNRFIEYYRDLFQTGDKVISIGSTRVNQIFRDMKGIICAENEYFVKLFSQDLLISQSYLESRNLIKNDRVKIVIERAGHRIPIDILVSELGPRKKNKTWIEYSLYKKNNLALLQLRQCIYNSTYKSTLRKFFKKVTENNIKNVVLDLRVNDGGDSRVVAEFIRYLKVDKYRWFGAKIRHSREVREIMKEQLSGIKYYPRPVKKNNPATDTNLIFSGKLFVFVSKNTFSSANMFAVTIKDNKIGKLIGEPTGNKPTCYGNPLNFKMPNTQIYFRVSYKQFLRPNQEADSEDSLYPDFEVYTSIEDVIHSKDPQLEYLFELLRN